ncbi:MAG: KamA family radical SAM protein [Nanoarchaeota archaeon]
MGNEFWKGLLQQGFFDLRQISEKFKIVDPDIANVIKTYPMFVNPYYLSLIKEENDAIWRQCIPDKRELEDISGFDDPLNEEGDSPVPGLTHRYPDRVLLLVSNKCAMYCRFCTRKRKVGHSYISPTHDQILHGIDYIKQHKEVRDVILSGGDPLLLQDEEIGSILENLRRINHLEMIRIGTRVPCTLPQRITPELCKIFKEYRSRPALYINTHFNHPNEITEESENACGMIVDSGIPLGDQTVLLKGVNDNVATMRDLMKKLVSIRVKPYYLYQADLTKGTNHFRTKVEKGLEVVEGLRGHISGTCIPQYVIDAPNGGGKIPLLPDYFQGYDKKTGKVSLKNYKGRHYEYIDP